eukprot:7036204-Ditylum_brightwellii.AAC.1
MFVSTVDGNKEFFSCRQIGKAETARRLHRRVKREDHMEKASGNCDRLHPSPVGHLSKQPPDHTLHGHLFHQPNAIPDQYLKKSAFCNGTEAWKSKY